MRKLLRKKSNTSEPVGSTMREELDSGVTEMAPSQEEASVNSDEMQKQPKSDVLPVMTLITIIFDGLSESQRYSMSFKAGQQCQAMFEPLTGQIYPEYLDTAVKHGLASIKR